MTDVKEKLHLSLVASGWQVTLAQGCEGLATPLQGNTIICPELSGWTHLLFHISTQSAIWERGDNLISQLRNTGQEVSVLHEHVFVSLVEILESISLFAPTARHQHQRELFQRHFLAKIRDTGPGESS